MTIAASASGQAAPAAPRARRRSRAHVIDRISTVALWSLAIVLIGLLAFIFLYVLAQGFRQINLHFLTTADGVGPQLFNTFYMLMLAMLFAVPLALSAAIYLSQYARQGVLVTGVRFAAETLAGVPSLLLGLFGFLVFVTVNGAGHRFGFSRLAGAATLAILNLPLLLRVFEDGLNALPRELREGSLAVGATRFQTVWRVLIPAALPALTTGVVLTAGKMIGEAAALIYTAGSNSGGSSGWLSLNPFLPGDTLTVKLYFLSAENPSPEAKLIANGTAALLVILLLIFNLGFRYAANTLNLRLRGNTGTTRRGRRAWRDQPVAPFNPLVPQQPPTSEEHE
jgi:phosphate transport system permease protein